MNGLFPAWLRRTKRALTEILRVGTFSLLAILSMIATTHGAPVIDPASGHSYELIKEGKTWAEARSAAAGMSTAVLSCHLATISSQAENDFVVGGPLKDVGEEDVWIGGEQRDSLDCTENDASFWGKWVTGEPWSYTNWAPKGEPDPAPDECPEACLTYARNDSPPDPLQWENEDCNAGTGSGVDDDDDDQFWYLVECEPRNFAPALSGAAVVILSLSMLASGWWVLRRRRMRVS